VRPDTSNGYPKKDSLAATKDTTDSSINLLPDKTKTDSVVSLKETVSKDSTKQNSIKDSVSILKNTSDSTSDKPLDSSGVSKTKVIKDSSTKAATDTIRYFQAFHNVRIYNDSLQAVCDSLYYTSRDSVFRLYKDPLVFSNKSQIAGDTINLFTKNRKADRIYVFDNGIIINEVNRQMYNQIAGRTLNGFFVNGTIDYMRVKGSPAESVFYPQDNDSAYTGMNRCKGDVIDIYFVNKAVNKIKFINDVDGIFFPLRQIPEDQKRLAKFKWLDSRRPKNKFELFE